MIKYLVDNVTKRRVIFRLAPYNRLSFPILLNTWEKHGIDQAFEIIIRQQPLTAGDLGPGDVVLFSFMTPNFPGIYDEIKEIKGKAGIIAGGGPHITGDRELPLKIGFDTLFVGPAESTFLQFGRDLIDHRPVKSIYAYESGSDSYRDFNESQPFSRYLDTIGPLEIMRGCSWNCSYCSTHSHEIWYRDIRSIDTYLRGMKKRGVNRVNFISPSSLEYGAAKPGEINTRKIRELLELTHSYHFRFIEYGIFPSEIRPDTVTEEGIALLKQHVSHKSITIGAQSSLDSRLKELKRGHTAADIERATVIAIENGFSVNLDFIIGYPGETPGERQANIEFIKTLNKKYRVKAHIHFFIPLPGSTYGYRLPSFLSGEEREELYRLRRGGVITDGWIVNEKQAQGYLDWLKDHFPGYYSRFQ